MINRTAKFNELTPSTLPFVEGKLQGHKDRKNFSIVGPGVAEDSKQFVKISKAHGFNLGAVIAKPKNGSGLHSHTTSEVFLIYSGKWRFYWGVKGNDEIILTPGDIISMPTNMFRAFENIGDDEGLIFVVLGGDDPGIITWVPDALIRAKETGMALLDDNSLIDLPKSEVPEGKKLLEPISDEELNKFDNYSLKDLEKFICKFHEKSNNETNIGNGIKIIQILGKKFENKNFDPIINQNAEFNLSILKSKKGRIDNLDFKKPTILFSQKGLWKIEIEGERVKLYSKDTFSVPQNSKISISTSDEEDSYLNCVSQI